MSTLDSIINNFLAKLATKEGISTPSYTWKEKTAYGSPARYHTLTETVILNEDLKRYYKFNSGTALEIIRFVLAHEFKHHLDHKKGVIIGTLYKGEVRADRYAQSITGLSRRAWLKKLIGIKKYTERRS